MNYTAPENFDPDRQGFAQTPSDIYGLGCLLFEMATGSAPWTGFALMAIFGKVCRGERPPLPPGLSPAMAGSLPSAGLMIPACGPVRRLGYSGCCCSRALNRSATTAAFVMEDQGNGKEALHGTFTH